MMMLTRLLRVVGEVAPLEVGGHVPPPARRARRLEVARLELAPQLLVRDLDVPRRRVAVDVRVLRLVRRSDGAPLPGLLSCRAASSLARLIARGRLDALFDDPSSKGRNGSALGTTSPSSPTLVVRLAPTPPVELTHASGSKGSSY